MISQAIYECLPLCCYIAARWPKPLSSLGNMEDAMKRVPLALSLACVTFGAQADNLDFSAAAGRKLKTEMSVPGVPSIDGKTWTATCRKGIAIAGHCEAQSGARNLQNVGVVEGTHWVCTWTEPTPKAQVTALCLFED